MVRYPARKGRDVKAIAAFVFLLNLSSIAQSNVGDCMQGEFTVSLAAGTSVAEFQEHINALPGLTGEADMPAEGTLLPGIYCAGEGASRTSLLKQIRDAQAQVLAHLWVQKSANAAVNSPEEAIILASIVEEESLNDAEKAMVAGVYSNRLRKAMMLQADSTIIYPLTKGKPLDRRTSLAELWDENGYNTYIMSGLPQGPITNPSRASIEAVLNPAKTNALFFVADGTGRHVFSDTLEEHNANVEKWYAIRRKQGVKSAFE
jgi:UPF0755 protein